MKYAFPQDFAIPGHLGSGGLGPSLKSGTCAVRPGFAASKRGNLRWELLGCAWKLPSMEFLEVLVGRKRPKIEPCSLATWPRDPTTPRELKRVSHIQRGGPAAGPGNLSFHVVPVPISQYLEYSSPMFFPWEGKHYPHHQVHSQCRSVNV